MSVVHGREQREDVTLDCDVVVVGSGASGSVVATELALAGQDVVVLEEGPHVPPEVYSKMRPSESMRHLWRDGATTFAVGTGDSPTINVTMGRCVGGSSVLTGGVCFRIPDAVLDTWSKGHGLSDSHSGEDGGVLRRRRARDARRGGAGLDALALDEPLRPGDVTPRLRDEADAPQHRRLQRLRALQLRMPAPREEERGFSAICRGQSPPARASTPTAWSKR